ncbi:hypothetical protein BEWA_008640 [Theileria equi strain WA]|uniref:Pantothenate kinase n=1 Tax=Theileria equi strain WA TaxID=1537102 RepID=L0B1V0_THEEQ|nr:hypothetical protein BEWA_008640 [Theileria equi strain WA]AFZ81453.1 hypothetical protein BEWA_008640 [Theileria equi strain WA]|eukprot:XP_004831119.1 hypothetical protein BEWA_008640 [Theileria equi strain WA]
MESCLRSIVDLQEHLLSSLDFSATHVLYELQSCCNGLLRKICNIDLYSHFLHGFMQKIDTHESIIDESIQILIKKYSDLSKRLKHELFSQITRKKNIKTLESIEFNGENVRDADDAYTETLEVSCPRPDSARISEGSARTTISLDIGGTLVKVAYRLNLHDLRGYTYLTCVYEAYCYSAVFVKYASRYYKLDMNLDYGDVSSEIDFLHSLYLNVEAGKNSTFCFRHVPISRIGELVRSITAIEDRYGCQYLSLTGGGSFKYRNMFDYMKNVRARDEMACLFEAVKFIHNIPGSVISYNLEHRLPKKKSINPLYPYLIVNIGSGISVIKVSSETEFRRVSGTSIAGGTAFGLINYLIPTASSKCFNNFNAGNSMFDVFNEYVDEATVKKYPPYGLKLSLGALPSDCGSEGYRDAYITSISGMIGYNIGTLGYLLAKVHEAKRAFFTGKFVCNFTTESIVSGFSFSSDVYNDKTIDICFPVHGGYIATLGCLLCI